MSDLSKRLRERHVGVTHKADHDDLTARKMCKECAPWASWPCDVQLALAEIEQLEARVAELGDFWSLLESMPIQRWQFSLHRLLTGEWQASFIDEADSHSGHRIAPTALEAVRSAIDAASVAALEEK